MRVCVWSLLVALSLGIATGCGTDEATLSAQGTPVEELVMDIGDASGSEDEFKAMFADGATVPEKDRKRYGEGFFRCESHEEGPEENTMILKVVFYDSASEIQGRADWTAVKQGEEWKLQEAPLPE